MQFDPAFLDRPALRLLALALVRATRASLHNAQGIPSTGGALIVGNHAFMGADAFVLGALLLRETQRKARWLAERNLLSLPGVATSLSAVGAIVGTPEAAIELLRAGELVCVYPGGIDDSWKPVEERNQIKWLGRSGFARVALAANVPIVPVAALGVDDAFAVVAREPWIGRRLFGSPRYDLPLALPGKLVPWQFRVLPLIAVDGDPEDPAAVDHVRSQAAAAISDALRDFRERPT
jgi:1-acyl-sn-glycerol-3-phosphate acyltransferase